MIFNLTKTSNWNTQEEKLEYEKLGFKFEKDLPYAWRPEKCWYDITDRENGVKIEFKSLEDFLVFVAQFGEVVIHKGGSDNATIEIYDDYRE